MYYIHGMGQEMLSVSPSPTISQDRFENACFQATKGNLTPLKTALETADLRDINFNTSSKRLIHLYDGRTPLLMIAIATREYDHTLFISLLRKVSSDRLDFNLQTPSLGDWNDSPLHIICEMCTVYHYDPCENGALVLRELLQCVPAEALDFNRKSKRRQNLGETPLHILSHLDVKEEPILNLLDLYPLKRLDFNASCPHYQNSPLSHLCDLAESYPSAIVKLLDLALIEQVPLHFSGNANPWGCTPIQLLFYNMNANKAAIVRQIFRSNSLHHIDLAESIISTNSLGQVRIASIFGVIYGDMIELMRDNDDNDLSSILSEFFDFDCDLSNFYIKIHAILQTIRVSYEYDSEIPYTYTKVLNFFDNIAPSHAACQFYSLTPPESPFFAYASRSLATLTDWMLDRKPIEPLHRTLLFREIGERIPRPMPMTPIATTDLRV